jgi:CheY-like chemotaxis protein
MAQRHGAELDIDSEPGRGTTIRIVFPASSLETSPTVRVQSSRLPEHPLRLLLIDDDPLIIESMANTLSTDGHTVVIADGGQAGIDAFNASLSRGEEFAVVITDLGMPYTDGRRVAAAIKAASPATPVIMLTGWGQRLLDDDEMPQDVDRVLNKPPKLSDLRRALAELVHPQ